MFPTVRKDAAVLKSDKISGGAKNAPAYSIIQLKEISVKEIGKVLFKLERAGIKLIIFALLRDKRLVVAALDYPAVFEDHDGL